MRVLTVAVALLLAVLASVTARADEMESQQSTVLIEQAIALIANDAGDERVAERIIDALQAPDKQGVDLPKVAQALEVVDQPGQDPAATASARALLVNSLGGTLPSAPQGGQMIVGTETGTSVIQNEIKPARGINDGGRRDPARPVTGRDPGRAIPGAAVATPHTPRQLIHPTEMPANTQQETR